MIIRQVQSCLIFVTLVTVTQANVQVSGGHLDVFIVEGWVNHAVTDTGD